jgi:hypothetical protein
MKKVLSLFLSLIMTFGITAGLGGLDGTVYGATSEGDFGGHAYGGKYRITSYSGEDEVVEIPSTINGYPVTEIGATAFTANDRITSVIIPEGVTTIENYAFEYAENLQSITIPDSVTSIGTEAFRYTGYYDNEANWQDGVLYIGNALIEAKTDLEGTYKVKEGTTILADTAFSKCTDLTGIQLPSSVKSIDGDAIRCDSLTSIEVASGNAYFSSEDGVLFNQDKTTLIQYPRGSTSESYTVPSGVKTIGSQSFYCARGLQKLIIPESVTTIGRYAFGVCSSLKDVTLSKGLERIETYAFNSCSALTAITIPEGVTYLGSYSFDGCYDLEKITLPSSLEYLGGNALRNTAYYKNNDNWENGALYVDSALADTNSELSSDYTIKDGTTILADSVCADNSSITSLTIPGSVKYVGDYAFMGCSQLDSVTIQEGVTSIGVGAFHYCMELKDISLPKSLTEIGGDAFFLTAYEMDENNWTDGGLYIGTALVEGDMTMAKDYQVADGTTVIAKGVFEFVEDMTNITLPESIKTIGEGILNIDSLQSVKVKAADCNIADSAKTITSGATIYGVAGSTAYDYAKKYDRTFKCLTHTYKDKVTKATTSKAGEIKQVCSACGETGKVTAISSPKEVILSAKNYTYNGKVKKPTVTVKDSNGKTIDKSNYTVKYSSGLKKVGTYKVTVTFKGNYSGTLTATYKINPKGTSLTKMYKRSKGFTAMWKKKGTQTTGYQVQYSTSSNFTDAKTVNVSKISQISKRVTGLKGKTKYYVRVRTYKTVNGVKYYSGWSKAKSVTTYR